MTRAVAWRAQARLQQLRSDAEARDALFHRVEGWKAEKAGEDTRNFVVSAAALGSRAHPCSSLRARARACLYAARLPPAERVRARRRWQHDNARQAREMTARRVLEHRKGLWVNKSSQLALVQQRHREIKTAEGAVRAVGRAVWEGYEGEAV